MVRRLNGRPSLLSMFAVVAALVLINVKKSDVTEVSESEVVVAA